MEEIKFREYLKGKLFGYERLTKDKGWEWMVMELNPDNGERWTKGVITHHDNDHPERFKRDQLIGKLDKNEKEIYASDIVKYAVKKTLCPKCSAKDITSYRELLHMGDFCPKCG